MKARRWFRCDAIPSPVPQVLRGLAITFALRYFFVTSVSTCCSQLIGLKMEELRSRLAVMMDNLIHDDD